MRNKRSWARSLIYWLIYNFKWLKSTWKMKCFNQWKNRNVQRKGGQVARHLHANDPAHPTCNTLQSQMQPNVFFFGWPTHNSKWIKKQLIQQTPFVRTCWRGWALNSSAVASAWNWHTFSHWGELILTPWANSRKTKSSLWLHNRRNLKRVHKCVV